MDEIDIGRIIRHLLMQSKLIITVVLVTFVLSLSYYLTATKYYKIMSLLQVENTNQNIFDPTNTIDIMSGNSSADISNLITLYESRTNLIKLIVDLQLNINFEDLLNNEKIDLDILPIDFKNEDKGLSTFFLKYSNNSLSLYDRNENFLSYLKIDETINTNGFQFKLNDYALNDARMVKITYREPSNLYNLIKNKLVVTTSTAKNSWFNQQGLIEVHYITDDVELGKKIIDYANNIFLNYRISVETEKARKAISFIDQNIENLENVVLVNKSKLKKFREENKSINVDLEIRAIIEKIQTIDNSLYEIEVEIANANELYTINNPIYANLVNKKNILDNQKEEILSQIQQLPREQQEYIDLYKEVEISETLFEELRNRKLGFSILEASTIGNIRIIDSAYSANIVSPTLSLVLLSTFLSLIIICLFAIIRGNNYLPVTNPAELFDNDIENPVVAVLPYVDPKDEENIENDLRFNSSMESFIVNLKSIQQENTKKNIIIITSASPFNGKSLVSQNLAKSLVKTGKKVLLIDSDLKRGSLNKVFNKKTIKKEEFLSIDESNITNYQINESLYFIPRISRLDNTFQFICSPFYQDKLNLLRNMFDYIVIDTAPILSVADTPILITKSDYAFFVIRHGLNKINEIKQSIESFNQINKNIDGFVYNAYAKPKSYYGYYGLYGNYSYEYYAQKYLYQAYEYKND